MGCGAQRRGVPALPARAPRRGGDGRRHRRAALAGLGRGGEPHPRPEVDPGAGASARSAERGLARLAAADASYVRRCPNSPLPDDPASAPSRSKASPCAAASCAWAPPSTRSCAATTIPEPVANLLGEACALAALVGSSLKFEGRLIVQAQGDGPGALRGGRLRHLRRPARLLPASTPTSWPSVGEGFARPGAQTLLGEGVFIMTVDQGPDMDRYQGVTAIEGETLALCAEQYFAQSEQTPTACAWRSARPTTARPAWRAGGVLIQNIAGDDARGSTEEAWTRGPGAASRPSARTS